jgi:hypothetical protein
MKKIAFDRLAALAVVTDAGPLPITRSQRLRRWRDLLRDQGDRPLRPLLHLEFRDPEDRAQCRADNSPLALAFADPVLRAAGLAGDTVGEAEGFFGLNARQTHYLLCDCHYLGAMGAGRVARRIDVLAHANPLAKAWLFLQAA